MAPEPSNPEVKTRKIYLNSFDDAAAGREAALALIRVGVDMLPPQRRRGGARRLPGGQGEPRGVRVRLQRRPGAPGAGAGGGSAVIDLPRAFLAVAREVKAGSFRPRVEAFGLASGVVRYVPNPALESLVDQTLRSRLQAAADSIAAGTLIAAPRPASMQAEWPG